MKKLNRASWDLHLIVLIGSCCKWWANKGFLVTWSYRSGKGIIFAVEWVGIHLNFRFGNRIQLSAKTAPSLIMEIYAFYLTCKFDTNIICSCFIAKFCMLVVLLSLFLHIVVIILFFYPFSPKISKKKETHLVRRRSSKCIIFIGWLKIQLSDHNDFVIRT